MAVQRKVFRIEEHARPRTAQAAPEGTADDAARHRQFMAELQSLRALITPAAPIDRATLERARAQIAEAQAYKAELDVIHFALSRAKDEPAVGAAASLSADRTSRIGGELRAIVSGTEEATQTILQAAEEIDSLAVTLAGALSSVQDQERANDIRQCVVAIVEACNFQDLTGQRVNNVLAAIKTIEGHIARLKSIWEGVERFVPIDLDDPGDRRFLNGPKLPGDQGHSTQDDIDGMFGCA